MRYLLLLITLWLISPTAEAITFAEGIQKCKAMNKAERSSSKLCQQVIARIKEYKAQGKPIPGLTANQEKPKAPETKPTTNSQLPLKSPIEKEVAKQEQIKNKCQKLSPPNQYKHPVCHQYMSLSNDPFLGQEPKNQSASYSISLGYSLMGNINGLDLEIERRTTNWGFGLFFAQQNISDLNDNDVSGSAYGASIRYHLTPLYYVKRNNPDVSAFLQGGMTNYTSATQGTLPSYMYFNMGLDASVPLFKMGSTTVRGFGKVGVTHIYHADSDFLSLGGSGTLGLKIDF